MLSEAHVLAGRVQQSVGLHNSRVLRCILRTTDEGLFFLQIVIKFYSLYIQLTIRTSVR